MNFKTSNVKLNGIQSYNVANPTSINFNSNASSVNYDSLSDYENIDYNSTDYETALQEEFENYDGFSKDFARISSSAYVLYDSVRSGVYKVGEYIVDGVTWLGGTLWSGILRLFGDEEGAKSTEEWTMDQIARDLVQEKKQDFYENTFLGRFTNLASDIKYDSEIANTVQNVSSGVATIAGATAATILTGGAAAPVFAAGFAAGAGESAEEHFKDKENRDFWSDSLDIAIDGGISGLSTVAAGKAGAAAVTGIKTIAGLGFSGIKETAKGTLKYFTKDALKSTIKHSGKAIAKNAAIATFRDKDFIYETGTVLLDNAKSCIDKGEVTWKDVGNIVTQTGTIYASNFIGNLAGGLVEGVTSYNSKIDNTVRIYSEGQDLATKEGYSDTFETYREHAEGHVYNVTQYAETHMDNVIKINKEEVIFGGLNHDLGMRSGYVKIDGKYVEISSLDPEKYDLGKLTRKNHPLNSAISILAEDLVPEGIDRDTVALLAMTHSKSTSGIRHMGSKSEWLDCIDNLEDAFKQYSLDSGLNTSDIAERFNRLRSMIDDDDTFIRLTKEALLIRDADAMSAVYTNSAGDTIMQNRQIGHVEKTSSRGLDFNAEIFDEKTECSTLTDYIYDVDDVNYENPLIDASAGVKYHAGELNVLFDTTTDADKYYNAAVKITEPNEIPHSTFFAITERIGEANTYTNVDSRTFSIVLPKEAEGTALGKWYEDQLKKHLIDLNTVLENEFDDGLINQATKKLQEEFYGNIKVVYGD